jgi:hypothetical protein
MPSSVPGPTDKPLVLQQVCSALVLKPKLAATICSVFPFLVPVADWPLSAKRPGLRFGYFRFAGRASQRTVRPNML